MSRKSKGCNIERELIHMFWQIGNWTAIRVAGSGSSHYPSPDILAGNIKRKLAIECKSSKKDKKYLTDEEIKKLVLFSKLFGAEPWIGVRFNNEEWYFLSIENIELTKKNYYLVSLDLAKKKGLLFEELINVENRHS